MSKFKGILDAAKAKEQEKSIPSSEISSDSTSSSRRGRPPGKRSNPNYEQVTAYVKRETYKNIKISLLKQDEFSDFSELVEALLSEWLKS